MSVAFEQNDGRGFFFLPTVFDIARRPIGGNPEIRRLKAKQFVVFFDLYSSVRCNVKEISVIAQQRGEMKRFGYEKEEEM